VDFSKLTIPNIKRIYPSLIADKLVNVQPLSGPFASIFYQYGHQMAPEEFVMAIVEWIVEEYDAEYCKGETGEFSAKFPALDGNIVMARVDQREINVFFHNITDTVKLYCRGQLEIRQHISTVDYGIRRVNLSYEDPEFFDKLKTTFDIILDGGRIDELTLPQSF
jgi:hypothetical protein